MSNRDDAMTTTEAPDRLFYAQGVFLDAADMEAEQQYHRGRLARALTYLSGHGTAAGLEVEYVDATTEEEDQLKVHAGIAVDRVGRLIEVPQTWCIRFDRWFTRPVPTNPEDLDDDTAAHHAALRAAGATGDPPVVVNQIAVDLYIRFVACDRGLTPAFAKGPGDATDAVVPARVRDAFELSLHIRTEGDVATDDTAALPVDPWSTVPAPAGGEDDVDPFKTRVLQAWRHGTEDFSDGQPIAPAWMPTTVDDTTSIFLARVLVPVTVAGPGELPERVRIAPDDLPEPALVNNSARPFVFSNAALAEMLSR